MSRIEKVQELILRNVAEILSRRIDNSRIGFISITAVKVSPDFSIAKVFYSQYGDDDAKKHTYWALRRASRFIKGELGKIMQMKKLPTLRFIYDDSLEKGVYLVNQINALSKNDPT